MTIQLKSKKEISIMRKANMIVYEVLEELKNTVSPGITTLDLDRIAKELTKKKGAEPAFLNYPSHSPNVKPFPGVICASKNDVIVHGIPNNEPLKEGDILSIDYGCSIDGFFGDSAITVSVGEISPLAQKLMDVTKECLEDAIKLCVPNNRLGDIGHAVSKRAQKSGFGVVREFVGHGIGKAMHEAPPVPNYGQPKKGRALRPGLVIAIEPMITEGTFETKILEDGWTASTRDGKLSAHFEHTVAVMEDGYYVLSRP